MLFSDLRFLVSVIVAVLLPLAVALAIWRVLSHARTPQGTVAWVVFLLAAPWFALPAYLFFGHHKLHGYTKHRRASHALVKRHGGEGLPADCEHVVGEQTPDGRGAGTLLIAHEL